MSWNTARILNNLAFDVSNLQKKTSEIVETNDDGTIFDKNIYSDGFVLNNGPTPAQFLLSDGTSTILNDSEYIISNTPPFNTISDITKSKGDVFYDTTTSSIYGFQPPFRDEPLERSLPSATY